MKASEPDSVQVREIVEKCLQAVLPAGKALPQEDEDWLESDIVDSMGHVEVLLCIESAMGLPSLFAKAADAAPTTTRSAVAIAHKALSSQVESSIERSENRHSGMKSIRGPAGITGWAVALGSERVTSDKIEEAFSLSKGTLANRAGIDSVCRASPDEDEVSLAKIAAQRALQLAGVSAQSADWIIGTSETHLCIPSFAASLHTGLLASSTCRALDVGGACVGLLNCFAVADALFSDPDVECILVASADVHSHILAPGKVPGEFAGLFGDGASAFVLRRSIREEDAAPYSIRTSIGSCSGAFSSALRVRLTAGASITLDFDGEALARAAVDRLERIIKDLETISGMKRDAVSAIALHQPNPRLVETLLRRTGLPADKVPHVAKVCGNLGSSTCGVALSMALDVHARKLRSERGPIMVASVGPGMLWAGAILS